MVANILCQHIKISNSHLYTKSHQHTYHANCRVSITLLCVRVFLFIRYQVRHDIINFCPAFSGVNDGRGMERHLPWTNIIVFVCSNDKIRV